MPFVGVSDARIQTYELPAHYASELPAGVSDKVPSGPASCLIPEPLEPTRQLWATLPFIREAARSLASLKNLEELYVEHGSVTFATENELKEALPNLKVWFVSSSSR